MGKSNTSKNFTKKRKLGLKKDNLVEDKVIKSLEKKLKLKKKSSKTLPKSFISDGLDYLLDICDEDTRKIAAESEKQFLQQSEDIFNTHDNINSDSTRSKIKVKDKINGDTTEVNLLGQKKCSVKLLTEANNVRKNKSVSNKINKISKLNTCINHKSIDEDENSNHSNKNISKKRTAVKKKNISSNKNIIISKSKKINAPIKKKKMSDDESSENEMDITSEDNENNDSINSSEENSKNEDLKSENSENEDLWEDIYGRKRTKDGAIISENKQRYIAPALRLKNFENNADKNEKLLFLKRQIKGLLNRLAESNMHAILSQLDELYMTNSRNDMNEMISNLMLESIVAPVITAERLVAEHMMCIAILHANIGTEVGAHFIMILVKKFNEMIQHSQEVKNKEMDNLMLMICHLYNFKIFGSQLIYQILEKLIDKFTEKEIDIILLILKTAGFRLRKDDPLALKELILNLQKKASTVKSSNTRIQFMLDILLAIKNNNMNKIPQYDQSHVEHLKKLLKTLIRKGNIISQLNLSLEDLLNADENGKWWIIGSAWSGKAVSNNKLTKTSEKPVYSQKILKLAQAQRMNTDIRKNIFCILMTAEDYLDAFEKLHHLGLKDRQEREIVYVILNCCLQEQNFNPYYAVLLQKFCEYDRKYQMTIQYTLWDKLKILNSYNSKQVINMAKLMSYLFIQKALPLSILKVIQLGELDKLTMKLFKKIMLDILLHENTETCLDVFEKIAPSIKLHQFRESLRLFINYFLLKNIQKDALPVKQMQLLRTRIELVDKILTNSTSKITF